MSEREPARRRGVHLVDQYTRSARLMNDMAATQGINLSDGVALTISRSQHWSARSPAAPNARDRRNARSGWRGRPVAKRRRRPNIA